MPGTEAPAEERFWRHVDRRGPDECWLWTGGTSGSSDEFQYGRFRTGGRDAPQVMAHRFSWEMMHGQIPDGLVVHHECNTPLCVNPDHLEAVTQRENLLRGDTFQARNAAKTHCKRGHPFDDENTYYRPNGGRGCRECKRQSTREWRARQRARGGG